MIPPQEAVERALALSRTDGCVVIADDTSSANLRWANNTLTTNGVTRNRELTVVAILEGSGGTAAGVVSGSGITCESLGPLVRAAEEAALKGAVLEDAQPLPAGYGAAAGWDEPVVETSLRVFSGFAAALGAAFSRARHEGRLLFGYAQHTELSTWMASSSGLRARHDQSSGFMEINARPADHSASVWAGTAGADWDGVDVQALDEQLTRRLGWARRRLSLPAARYETLLPPSAVADLMLALYGSAGARDAYDGRTVFSRPGGTRVGERIASLPVTLRSDPAAPGLRCTPFVVARASGDNTSVFDNGQPLSPTDWIRNGMLSALVQTRYSSQLTKLPFTPHVDNLILEGPADGRTLAEMVEDTARGLLLTCLWYTREVDPRNLLLTGLTRDGVFLVEGGEVVGAVNNFRFNESPVALLGRIAEAGASERTLARERGPYFTRTVMPALRIADFNMSTVSEAL